MRQGGFLYGVAAALCVFILAGCLSAIPNTPNPRFYMLSSMDASKASKTFDIAPGTIIAIGPIGIPEYQNRPQMVTKKRDGTLIFAQFDRWGESLDAGLARVLNDNLTLMLPQASLQIFPCNFAIPVNYQVIVEVVQLESELDKDMLFTAQWSVIDAKSREMLLTKRTQLREEIKPHNYFGLAQALSSAGVSLSSEIAASLSELSMKSKQDTVAK